MKLSKLLAAMTRPSYWPVLLKRILPTVEHRVPLARVSPATVIDVGANKGQFSAFARNQWPQARIHAFEPLHDQAERYSRVMKNDAILHRVALGANTDRMELHVASRADSSSLLPLGKEQKRLFRMDEIGTTAVPVMRLDAVLSPFEISGPALLKIDVQGFEYEVLQGIDGLVDKIRWIYVEVSFVELYEGQKLYEEIERRLTGLGYDNLGKSNVSYDDTGREIQADMLFERTSSTLLASHGIDGLAV